ncbi:MAG: T9SS type A sorting domain-containing protein [Candidatus Cloacimonetes bacterium]|nr:T9SS type A sorting domain-containing protein [Candidatus Cloacimonadota bacterium]MCF7867438.1 T9SS type A sorting domain-containing protein [Candidatus Cloacimonadota bacterium]MCF7882930.1 T9SS type A sorting domain-containing protein [Candidatus Cloacimonadota bacterium]
MRKKLSRKQILLLISIPNPFNPTVTFKIKAEDYDNLQIEIFNVKGQRIKTLPVILSGVEGSITWNAENQASGVYFCKLVNLETKKQLALQKVTLLK